MSHLNSSLITAVWLLAIGSLLLQIVRSIVRSSQGFERPSIRTLTREQATRQTGEKNFRSPSIKDHAQTATINRLLNTKSGRLSAAIRVIVCCRRVFSVSAFRLRRGGAVGGAYLTSAAALLITTRPSCVFA